MTVEILMNTLVLAAYSAEDIKFKRIPLLWILIGTALMLAPSLLTQGFVPSERLPGLLPGAAAVIISLVTRGGLGLADGLILCGTGLAIGLDSCVKLSCVAVFAAGAFAAAMWLFKIMGRKDSFAFAPFLFLGYAVSLVL